VDFFESQDQARKRTGRLVVLFALAVIAIAATLYALAVAVTGYGGQDPYTGATIWQKRPRKISMLCLGIMCLTRR